MGYTADYIKQNGTDFRFIGLRVAKLCYNGLFVHSEIFISLTRICYHGAQRVKAILYVLLCCAY